MKPTPIKEQLYATMSNDYRDSFWRFMHNKESSSDAKNLVAGKKADGTYLLPYKDAAAFAAALKEQSLFRMIGTVQGVIENDGVIYVPDSDDLPRWVAEGQQVIPSDTDTFSEKYCKAYKLAILTSLGEDFVSDTGFDLQQYIISRFSKCFGMAEEDAFINGTGINMPKGILHETDGAKTGVTVAEDFTFDDVIHLYFSLDKRYRRNGCWLMSDETALKLRTLKNQDGLYLWPQSSDTLLGKEVHISEYMPSDSKPIAFGDFSYYRIIDRQPLSARILNELYAMERKIGFIAVERLDGMLTRPEAVKLLRVGE